MHNTKYFETNRHATWLECFFDLIFVVTIDDVTHILSHTPGAGTKHVRGKVIPKFQVKAAQSRWAETRQEQSCATLNFLPESKCRCSAWVPGT
jgi:hypothetical protein